MEKEEDKKLYELMEYIDYLLNYNYKVYNRLNKGHIKKIKKLLKEYYKEYIKREWK